MPAASSLSLRCGLSIGPVVALPQLPGLQPDGDRFLARLGAGHAAPSGELVPSACPDAVLRDASAGFVRFGDLEHGFAVAAMREAEVVAERRHVARGWTWNRLV